MHDITYECQDCNVFHCRDQAHDKPTTCMRCQGNTLELVAPPLHVDPIEVYYTTDSGDTGGATDVSRSAWAVTDDQVFTNTDPFTLSVSGPFPVTVSGIGLRLTNTLREEFPTDIESTLHRSQTIRFPAGDINIPVYKFLD